MRRAKPLAGNFQNNSSFCINLCIRHEISHSILFQRDSYPAKPGIETLPVRFGRIVDASLHAPISCNIIRYPSGSWKAFTEKNMPNQSCDSHGAVEPEKTLCDCVSDFNGSVFHSNTIEQYRFCRSYKCLFRMAKQRSPRFSTRRFRAMAVDGRRRSAKQ